MWYETYRCGTCRVLCGGALESFGSDPGKLWVGRRVSPTKRSGRNSGRHTLKTYGASAPEEKSVKETRLPSDLMPPPPPPLLPDMKDTIAVTNSTPGIVTANHCCPRTHRNREVNCVSPCSCSLDLLCCRSQVRTYCLHATKKDPSTTAL